MFRVRRERPLAGVPRRRAGQRLADEIPEIAPVEPFEPAPTRETSWDYTHELGNVVFRISRGAGKEFRPHHRNRHGTTVMGLAEYRPLYRLPELIEGAAAGRTIYVAEGEKDVESLRALGAVATCSVGGAGKFGRAAEIERLEGAAVVVVADRDGPGLRHALDVQRLLRRRGLGRDRAAHGRQGRLRPPPQRPRPGRPGAVRGNSQGSDPWGFEP